MKKLLIAIAAALSVAAVIASMASTADARGGGGRAAWSGRSHAWVHRGGARAWPHCRRGDCGRPQSLAYDGYVDVSPFPPDVLSSMDYFPSRAYFVTGLPRGLNCRRSQETVAVPSEAGGVRQIVVRRCYP